jgi:hypothetical protein
VVENAPYAKAHQAIGEYFCTFSGLERELGEAIKVVLPRGMNSLSALATHPGEQLQKQRPADAPKPFDSPPQRRSAAR